MNWNFQREEQQFDTIPVGEHRVRIASVEKATSKKGSDMLVIKLDVSNYTQQLWHYIVFLQDNPEITNRNLTSLFDSFGIADGDFNLQNWVGKVGACKTKVDDYGAKVQYFIHKNKQDKLPAWVEGKAKTSQPKPKIADLQPVTEDELPF